VTDLTRIPSALLVPVLFALGCQAPGPPAERRAPATVDEWIRSYAIPIATDSSMDFDHAIDAIVGSSDSVTLLGFGEPLHLGEDFLMARNRIFRHLVEAHGFRAIALESSFPGGWAVDRYVSGGGSYEAIADSGFGWGFGRLEANHQLIEWMRTYNADSAHAVKLRYYGFDLESSGSSLVAGPQRPLGMALDYLGRADETTATEFRRRLDSLVAALPPWEDLTRKAALAPAGREVRLLTEDLIAELRSRRPELVQKTDPDRYRQALQLALSARATLNFHALAPERSFNKAGGARDAAMAETLAFIVERERERGRVFVFAHNGHLQRVRTEMPQASGDTIVYWPLGTQLDQLFGTRYRVIGSAVAVSDTAAGVSRAEPQSLESRLAAVAGPALFLRTYPGLEAEVARLPARSRSTANPSYQPLGTSSLGAFDWLYFRDSTGVARQSGVPAEGSR
jgi:erythromycin esterase-like protein